jgi:recombination protein RecR
MQDELGRIQEEVAARTVEASAGGGMVTAVANGRRELVSLRIDPQAVDPRDVKMLEDLVLAAVNQALNRARPVLGLLAVVLADPIARLVHELAKLPGIGEKTAARLAFFILKAPESYATDLADALREVRTRIRLCSVCQNLTAPDPCVLCGDARRDRHVVCVVAQAQDVIAVERAGTFRGLYHVLHGVLSPLEGVGPDDLKIRELLGRIGPGGSGGSTGPGQVDEVILATSPNVEGEATALYLARILKPLGVRVSRIASGVPIGGDLEFADQVTISRALEGRREL